MFNQVNSLIKHPLFFNNQNPNKMIDLTTVTPIEVLTTIFLTAFLFYVVKYHKWITSFLILLLAGVVIIFHLEKEYYKNKKSNRL